MRTPLLIFVILVIVSCNSGKMEVRANQNSTNFSSDSIAINSDHHSKEFITKTYTQAITDFIKASSQKHKTKFDTLYFGKHVYEQADDFPDIELPQRIENTEIRIIDPETGSKLQKERRSLVYINLMGWINKENAEFIFVTFTNGSEHQYDCYINYKFNTEIKKFEVEKLKFEYFAYKPQ